MEKINFTKTKLKTLQPTESIQRFGDIEQPGLILQIMPSGYMSFCFQRKVKGRTTRISIGSFPETPIDIARKSVREMLNKVAAGENAVDRGDSMTTDQLLEEFKKEFLIRVTAGERRLVSLENIERNYRLHIKPSLGDRKICNVDSKIVDALISAFRQKAPSVHNKCLTACKSLWNFAVEREWIKTNPFSKYNKLSDKIRERFLQPDEMERFFSALEFEPQIYRDVILMTLFTGQRKSCVLAMEWCEIDFTNGLWHIPTSKMKGKRQHTVPLIRDMLDILVRRNAEKTNDAKYVFPSSHGSASGHITEKTGSGGFWRRVTTRAGLYSEDKDKNLTVHDLRRTLASWQAMNNESLIVISKVLGHRDTKVTASVYAHLQTGGARGGIEAAATAIKAAIPSSTQVEPSSDDKIKTLVSELSAEDKEMLLKLLSNS